MSTTPTTRTGDGCERRPAHQQVAGAIPAGEPSSASTIDPTWSPTCHQDGRIGVIDHRRRHGPQEGGLQGAVAATSHDGQVGLSRPEPRRGSRGRAFREPGPPPRSGRRPRGGAGNLDHGRQPRQGLGLVRVGSGRDRRDPGPSPERGRDVERGGEPDHGNPRATGGWRPGPGLGSRTGSHRGRRRMRMRSLRGCVGQSSTRPLCAAKHPPPPRANECHAARSAVGLATIVAKPVSLRPPTHIPRQRMFPPAAT